MSRIWPGRNLALRWVLMAVSLWVLVHSILFAASGEVFVFSSANALLIALGAAATVGFVDMRRKRESALLRNLGVVAFAAPAFWVATFVALEIALAVVSKMA